MDDSMDDVFNFLEEALEHCDDWSRGYPWHWPSILPGDGCQERPVVRYAIRLPRMHLVYRTLRLYPLPKEWIARPQSIAN